MRFSVLTDYLGRFLDAVCVRKAVLSGNSLGGAVVIRYAATHPDRVSHLFLLDSAGLHARATIAATQPETREEARETIKAVAARTSTRLASYSTTSSGEPKSWRTRNTVTATSRLTCANIYHASKLPPPSSGASTTDLSQRSMVSACAMRSTTQSL
jgi:pimeloyl-ACP methyl ester carboxylesterase